jgi:uncharacterized membrane protein YccC
VIISFGGGANSENAFQTAATRIQETGLGILIYTLVTVFLWPRSSRTALDETSGKLVAAQRRAYNGYRDQLAGHGAPADLEQLRQQGFQLFSQLEQAFDAAEADTYEVWEVRHQWRRFLRQSMALRETLERWRLSFPEVQPLDLTKLLPNLEAVCSEVDLRLAQIERMLAGEKPDRTPQAITLAIDKAELHSLPHFQKAALALTKAHLDQLNWLSQSLFECVGDIKGYAPQAWAPSHERSLPTGLAFDVDRFQAAIRVLAGMWLAFFVWIYIDPPGNSGVVTLVVPLGLAFALMPQLRVSTTFLPTVLSFAFAGVFYFFVMPHLSGYAQLGLMIFGVTFAINYLLAEPRQALAKMFCLVFFLVLTSIDNQQTYSFPQFASTTAMIILVLSILVVTAYIPNSPRPEKVFLRLLSRYFRHAEFLMARISLDREHKRGLAGRWKAALYRNDLMELPEKLALWGQHIDYRTFPANTPEQVQALVRDLQALAYRIKELVEVRKYSQADLLVRELSGDFRAWRTLVENRFRLWAENPGVAIEPGGEVRDRMTARMAKFQTRLDETFRLAGEGDLKDEDYENAYRLLGGFRGLSEAMIDYTRLADGINWAQWREARF